MEHAKADDIFTRQHTSDRVSTGVPGLDDILHGGLPRNRFYLVEGRPGSGKTTLALQFLLEGRRRGEAGLYVTLSETKEELLDVARSHGWSLDGIGLYELEAIERKLQPEEQYTVFHPAEVELSETAGLICAEVERLQPTRVVFDSLSEMRLLARDPLRYRRQILLLKQFFTGRQCTVLWLDDRTELDKDLQLQTMSHGVIVLDRVPSDYGTARRRLQVVKMRGVQFRDGFHDFVIHRGGVYVYPRLIAAETRTGRGASGELVSSNVAELDNLVGGGLDRGTSALIIGPAGSGKSTLVSQYVLAAAARGEAVACYMFEEARDTFLARSDGLGIDIRQYIDSGLVTIQQIDPAELAPGEFASRVKQAIEDRNVRLVVIDSLNGYLNAMPSERFLLIHVHELLSYLGNHGVLTLLTLAQHGFIGGLESPVEVSFIADTVILLRYFEAEGAVRMAISVGKKRRGAHEKTIREFVIGPVGVHVGQPLREFHGVLGGMPEYRGGKTGLFEAEARDGRR